VQSLPYCYDEREGVGSTYQCYAPGCLFLVSVVEPLQLTIQAPLQNENADQLGLGLQDHLSTLRSRGFPGVLIDDGGASDYVPKADATIKRIKELYMAVKNDLPWKLPSSFVKYLVGYAVGRLNIRRMSSLSTPISPYRLFTETKINYRNPLP
jgi:hypothetical protein